MNRYAGRKDHADREVEPLKHTLRIEGVAGTTEIRVAARRILRAKAEPLLALEELAVGGRDTDAVLRFRRLATAHAEAALRAGVLAGIEAPPAAGADAVSS